MTRYLHRCLIVLFCLGFSSVPGYSQTRPKVVIGHASMSSVATTAFSLLTLTLISKGGVDYGH